MSVPSPVYAIEQLALLTQITFFRFRLCLPPPYPRSGPLVAFVTVVNTRLYTQQFSIRQTTPIDRLGVY